MGAEQQPALLAAALEQQYHHFIRLNLELKSPSALPSVPAGVRHKELARLQCRGSGGRAESDTLRTQAMLWTDGLPAPLVAWNQCYPAAPVPQNPG